jgi:hypothetical protein
MRMDDKRPMVFEDLPVGKEYINELTVDEYVGDALGP